MPTIIVRYFERDGQWRAWFEDAPQAACHGEFYQDAVRRLLESHAPSPGQVRIHVDASFSGTAVLERHAEWQPPELLFPCDRCDGKGQYAGVSMVEECRPCGGRGAIPA